MYIPYASLSRDQTFYAVVSGSVFFLMFEEWKRDVMADQRLRSCKRFSGGRRFHGRCQPVEGFPNVYRLSGISVAQRNDCIRHIEDPQW